MKLLICAMVVLALSGCSYFQPAEGFHVGTESRYCTTTRIDRYTSNSGYRIRVDLSCENKVLDSARSIFVIWPKVSDVNYIGVYNCSQGFSGGGLVLCSAEWYRWSWPATPLVVRFYSGVDASGELLATHCQYFSASLDGLNYLAPMSSDARLDRVFWLISLDNHYRKVYTNDHREVCSFERSFVSPKNGTDAVLKMSSDR